LTPPPTVVDEFSQDVLAAENMGVEERWRCMTTYELIAALRRLTTDDSDPKNLFDRAADRLEAYALLAGYVPGGDPEYDNPEGEERG
jgi:hypothetical protein